MAKLNELRSKVREFEKKAEFDEKIKSQKTTGMKFTSVSGEKIEPLYGPDDVENINYLNDIGFPGEYP